MSGQILGLDHVNFTASHEMIDELCRFYVEILGLKTGDRPPFDRHGYWIYAGDRPIIHLIVNRAGDEREMGRNTSFDHVALHCQGARDMVARLDALGVAYRLQLIPRTGAHQIFLRDPAGHGVELNFEIGDDPAQPIAKDWTRLDQVAGPVDPDFEEATKLGSRSRPD